MALTALRRSLSTVLLRLRLNLRDGLRALRYGDDALRLFLAGGALAWGLLLLVPGPTLASHRVYVWLEAVPDPALGWPMLALGLCAGAARTVAARRAAALALCFAWGALAVAIGLGTAHNVSVDAARVAGPSAAVVHYLGWAVLAFLLAYRAAEPAAPDPPPTTDRLPDDGD